jgi:hypothetical protein
VIQHDLELVYISGLLQCLLFACSWKRGSRGFRKTTLVVIYGNDLVVFPGFVEIYTFLSTGEFGEEQEAAGAGGQDRGGEAVHHQSAGAGVGDSQRGAHDRADPRHHEARQLEIQRGSARCALESRGDASAGRRDSRGRSGRVAVRQRHA